MSITIKKYVQYQKPQILMLKALCLPLLAAIYNFGWRAALCVLFSVFCCWLAEYLFTRKDKKPASAAALVTGAILGLILPPNIPFWQIFVGSFFSIIFAKMVFGGFGKNIFNPAMVGRCFLYICFPATMAASWFTPFQGGPAGFLRYSPDFKTMRTQDVNSSLMNIDGVTSATTLTAVKKLNAYYKSSKTDANKAKAIESQKKIPLLKLFIGNINGSIGETSAFLIIIALIYLAYNKVIFLPLYVGPIIGMVLGKLFLNGLGADQLPFMKDMMVSLLAGGTLFAITFMITEPITAPMNSKARWIYAGLIGFLATVIRSMSAFNEGFMFAVLLGNTFGPLIEIGCKEWEAMMKKKDAPIQEKKA